MCVSVFAWRRRATTELANGRPLRTRVQKCTAKVGQENKSLVQADKVECVFERGAFTQPNVL